MNGGWGFGLVQGGRNAVAKLPPQDVLSQCLERLEQDLGGVDDLLAQHPTVRAEVEPLLLLVQRLRALPPVVAPERLRRAPLWRSAVATAPADGTHATPASTSSADAEPSDAAAELLDACLEAEARSSGGSEALLAAQPALRDEVAPLLTLAAALQALPPIATPASLRQQPRWRAAQDSSTDSAAPESLPAPLHLP